MTKENVFWNCIYQNPFPKYHKQSSPHFDLFYRKFSVVQNSPLQTNKIHFRTLRTSRRKLLESGTGIDSDRKLSESVERRHFTPPCPPPTATTSEIPARPRTNNAEKDRASFLIILLTWAFPNDEASGAHISSVCTTKKAGLSRGIFFHAMRTFSPFEVAATCAGLDYATAK